MLLATGLEAVWGTSLLLPYPLHRPAVALARSTYTPYVSCLSEHLGFRRTEEGSAGVFSWQVHGKVGVMEGREGPCPCCSVTLHTDYTSLAPRRPQGKTFVHTVTGFLLLAMAGPMWDAYRLAKHAEGPLGVSETTSTAVRAR